jgi:hypothetical protein
MDQKSNFNKKIRWLGPTHWSGDNGGDNILFSGWGLDLPVTALAAVGPAFLCPQFPGGIGKGRCCTEVSDREQHYEHYQVVCDGSAWICLADRQCTGPSANPPTPIDWPVTRPTPAPVTDTTTTATNRNPDSSANPLNPAPITGSGIGIHKLHTQLRYAGHELPEFLRSDHRRDAGKSGRGRE